MRGVEQHPRVFGLSNRKAGLLIVSRITWRGNQTRFKKIDLYIYAHMQK